MKAQYRSTDIVSACGIWTTCPNSAANPIGSTKRIATEAKVPAASAFFCCQNPGIRGL